MLVPWYIYICTSALEEEKKKHHIHSCGVSEKFRRIFSMYSEIWPQIQLEEVGSWQIIRIWSPGIGMCGNVNLEKFIKTKTAEE